MSNKLALLGFAVQQADNARGAMLKFHVAAALAFNAANVTEGNLAGDEVKAALKKALRDRGEDRKTADRWVNDAAKMAVPLVERVALDWSGTVADGIDGAIAALRQLDVRNVAELRAFCGLVKVKAKDEPGADLAAMIGGIADGGNPAGEEMGGMPEAPEAPEVSQIETPVDPVTLDLSKLDDEALAMLAEMVAAEMVARQEARKAAIAA